MRGKRITALLLAAAMSLSLLCGNAWAAESVPEGEAPQTMSTNVVASGYCGEGLDYALMAPLNPGDPGTNLSWTLDSDGVLTIRGKGNMAMAAFFNPWTYYGGYRLPIESVKSIAIETGVTNISNSIFSNFENLTSVQIPDTVTSIEPNAFCGCKKLSVISIPDSVTSIGWGAFENDTALCYVRLPGGLDKIDQRTFWSCTSLASVALPESITSIEMEAFGKCSALSGIRFPNNVTKIGPNAFYGCSSLTRVSLPEKVCDVANSAFLDCTHIETVTMYKNLTGFTSTKYDRYYTKGGVSCTAFENCPIQAVYGFRNTYAEQFAKSRNVQFIPIGEETPVARPYPDREIEDVSDADSTANYITNQTIPFHYSASDGTRRQWQFPYSDYYFFYNEKNIRFCQPLALASLSAAMSGYTDVETISTKETYQELLPSDNYRRAFNIRELYHNLKFSGPRFYNYDVPLNDASDKVAFSLAHKYVNAGEDINDLSQGEDTVIAVVVRGGGYGAEWASNFNLVNGTDYDDDHYAFRTAAEEVERKVTAYVKELKAKDRGLRGELKIWITGYSRGSAVANKVAHDFNQNGVDGTTIHDGNMYAYTFATPNVGNRFSGVRLTDISYKAYPKDADIFNIVSPADVVPRVPFSLWGYGRYGHTLFLPSDSYASLWSRYKALSGKDPTKSDSSPISAYQPHVVDGIEAGVIAGMASNRIEYRTKFQNVIWAAFYAKNQGPGGDSDWLQTAVTGASLNPELTKLLLSEAANLGRAHEPEHYYARLELDHLRDIADFNETIPQQRIIIRGLEDNKDVVLTIYTAGGAAVGGMVNGNITTDAKVTCNSDGTVKSRNQTASISMVGGVCYIDLYDENCTVEVTSDKKRTISYESQTLDENMVPTQTDARSDLSLTPGDTLSFREKTAEVIPLEKDEQFIYASSYKKTLGDKAFYSDAQNDGDGALRFTSSNKKVATVSSKTGKITIKGVGKTTITVTALETDLFLRTTRKITVTVNPKGVKLSGVKNVKGKKAQVSWKQGTSITGYQIQYGTKKDFKGAKTVKVKGAKKKSYTITKLKKKKKYYVRLRTYKTVSKKDYCSKWSGAKDVTIKK